VAQLRDIYILVFMDNIYILGWRVEGVNKEPMLARHPGWLEDNCSVDDSSYNTMVWFDKFI
jgi:hypothetical protein